MIGSDGDVCDLVTGQCACKPNYGSRKCDQCRDGYFNYPTCSGKSLLTYSILEDSILNFEGIVEEAGDLHAY